MTLLLLYYAFDVVSVTVVVATVTVDAVAGIAVVGGAITAIDISIDLAASAGVTAIAVNTVSAGIFNAVIIVFARAIKYSNIPT